MFTNQYLIALGIPTILLISGEMAKKLVRGTGWQRFDFFLGVEFTLASMSSALIHFFDLVKGDSNPASGTGIVMPQVAATSTFVAIAFFLLLFVLATHQDWEKRNNNPTGQILWLGLMSNFVGAGLLATFVLLVKGI